MATPRRAAAARASNQYQFQLERASLVSAPVPNWLELPFYTAKVAQNNFYGAEPSENDAEAMKFVASTSSTSSISSRKTARTIRSWAI